MKTVTVVISVTMRMPDGYSIHAPLQEALSNVVEDASYGQHDYVGSQFISRDGTKVSMALSRMEQK